MFKEKSVSFKIDIIAIFNFKFTWKGWGGWEVFTAYTVLLKSKYLSVNV